MLKCDKVSTVNHWCSDACEVCNSVCEDVRYGSEDGDVKDVCGKLISWQRDKSCHDAQRGVSPDPQFSIRTPHHTHLITTSSNHTTPSYHTIIPHHHTIPPHQLITSHHTTPSHHTIPKSHHTHPTPPHHTHHTTLYHTTSHHTLHTCFGPLWSWFVLLIILSYQSVQTRHHKM